MNKTWLFSGRAHPALAREVAARAGIRLGRADISHFPDGELCVQVKEDVKGAHVFLIQPTCSSEAIVEVLLLTDALKRCRPRRLVLLVPYFGYGRQERRTERSPVSAQVMARLLSQSGADALVTVEMHAAATSRSLALPHNQLSTADLFADYIRQQAPVDKESIVVAPDDGAHRQARQLRQALEIERPVLPLSKLRLAPDRCKVRGPASSSNLFDCTAILVDDIISTGGTLIEAAQWLREHGASSVWACVSHLVGCPNTLSRRLESSPIERLFVTNSLPRPVIQEGSRITVLSLAPTLAFIVQQEYRQFSPEPEGLRLPDPFGCSPDQPFQPVAEGLLTEAMPYGA